MMRFVLILKQEYSLFVFVKTFLLIGLSLLCYPMSNTASELSPATLESTRLYEFDQLDLASNGWSEIPGGFTESNPGQVVANVYLWQVIPSSKDHIGIMLSVDANEVAFIYASNAFQTSGKPVLLRMTVQSDSPNVAIALAVLKGNLATNTGVDGSIATHIPMTAANFVDKDRRIILVYEPDAGETITPIIQVSAPDQTGGANVAIDRLEIIPINPDDLYLGREFQAVTSSEAPVTTPTQLLKPTETATIPDIISTPTPTVKQDQPTPIFSPTPTPLPTLTNPIPTSISGDSTPTPAPGDTTFEEQEPNDLLAQPQFLAVMSLNQSVEVTGSLSSGGVQNEDFIGDKDHYRFELLEGADVKAMVNWNNTADVDIISAMSDRILAYDLETRKPAFVQGTLAPGSYEILVASKNQGANYTLSIHTSPPTQFIYPNDVSILNRDYGHFNRESMTTTTLHTLKFDGKGNYESWRSLDYYNPDLPGYGQHQDNLEHAGTYTILYPLLIFHHDNIEEYYLLYFESENSFYLNGVRYT